MQGSNSLQPSHTGEKLSDSWKAGMESRMDFLQSNLTELLQLIKGGVASNNVPNVSENRTATRVTTPPSSERTREVPTLNSPTHRMVKDTTENPKGQFF